MSEGCHTTSSGRPQTSSTSPFERSNNKRAIWCDDLDAGLVGRGDEIKSFAELCPHDALEREHEPLELTVETFVRQALLHDGDRDRAP